MFCVKNKSSSNYNTAAYKTKCWHDVIYEKIYICSISIFLHQKFRRRISQVFKLGGIRHRLKTVLLSIRLQATRVDCGFLHVFDELGFCLILLRIIICPDMLVFHLGIHIQMHQLIQNKVLHWMLRLLTG